MKFNHACLLVARADFRRRVRLPTIPLRGSPNDTPLARAACLRRWGHWGMLATGRGLESCRPRTFLPVAKRKAAAVMPQRRLCTHYTLTAGLTAIGLTLAAGS
jgi:hypothetical protein